MLLPSTSELDVCPACRVVFAHPGILVMGFAQLGVF